MQRNKTYYFPILLTCCVVTYFVGNLITPQYPDLAIYGCLGLAVALFPIFDLLAHRDIRVLPIIVYSSLTYVLFLFPLLQTTFEYIPTSRFDPASLNSAAFYALVGLVSSVIAGYCVNKRQMWKLLGVHGEITFRPRSLGRLALLLSFISVVEALFHREVVQFSSSLSRVLLVVEQLPVLAICLGTLAVLEGYQSFSFRLWLYVVFLPVQCLIVVSRSLFSYLFMLLAPVFILITIRKRRPPIGYMLLAIIIFTPAFVGRMEWRKRWKLQDERSFNEMSLAESLKYGYERMEEVWTKPTEARERESLADEQGKVRAKARFNDLALLAHCVAYHEQKGKPFKYGSTFWWLPLSPLPRILFPWKPESNHGVYFGVEYEMKTIEEDYALILPMMVESYVNGGIVSVIAINSLIAVFYVFCFSTFQYGKGTLNLIAMISVIAIASYIESNITMIIGACLQAMTVWYVVDRYVLPRQTRTRAPQPPKVSPRLTTATVPMPEAAADNLHSRNSEL